MNHQPFEKWIFEDESLDPQQQENLNAHLETCETCSDLTIALTQFENTVHHSPSPEIQRPVSRNAGRTVCIAIATNVNSSAFGSSHSACLLLQPSYSSQYLF